jgi:hypothetical protein
MPEYRIYIDESGNHDLNVGPDSLHRYLSLTGVMIKEKYARSTVRPAFEGLKNKHFSHWPEQPVILHRKDIVNRLGPFEVLKDEEKSEAFNQDILTFLKKTHFHVITVMIDKHAHKEKYKVWRAHPYHYCMEVIIEKYAQWLVRNNGTGDVVAEARDRKSDKKLKKAFRYFYKNGTGYVKNTRMQSLLTSPELKLYPKTENIAALQIADLIAHPSAASIKAWANKEPAPVNFGGQISKILIDEKYDRSWIGKINGYGRKWLPT